MNKIITILIVSLLAIALIIFIILYSGTYFVKAKVVTTNSSNPSINNTDNISSTGNDEIVKINSKSTIRIINSYDKRMFEGKKCILLMWGSWCPNCAEEFDDLKEILDYYKDTDIRIVFISHDYELDTLVSFVEREDIDYDTEIYLDLGRVIRSALDPEASTVPVTYFLDENTNVIKKHDQVITLKEVKDIIKEIGW